MRSVAPDRSALEALPPETLEAYLRGSGWVEVRRTPGLVALWRRLDDRSGRNVELLVPLDRELGDYVERLADVFQRLESLEGRSAGDIFRLLSASLLDRMTIRLDRSDSEDGTIPLLAGADAFRGTKDLLLAAAASEFTPRTVHPPGMREAKNALRHARLGQTAHGSYIITVSAQLPPTGNLFAATRPDLVPVERKVFRRAALALGAMKRASADLSNEGFENGVTHGISANICRAVARLGQGRKLRSVNISLNWGTALPPPQDVPTQVVFSPHNLMRISEAAEYLRQSDPQQKFILRGRVIQLRKTEDMPEGAIVVKGPVDEKEREVAMNVTLDHYALAWDAHHQTLPVTCEGELLVRGNTYKLLAVTRFVIG
jgi:hypothetical protein